MVRLSTLRSEIRKLRRQLDAQTPTGEAEGLWTGTLTREGMLALEIEPDQQTGAVRPGAGPLALKLLDTVTFPAMLKERRRLPPERTSFCWLTEGWRMAELIQFFEWLNGPDPDLYALTDELADRYRDQLHSAHKAWTGDRIMTAWILERLADGDELQGALERLDDPDQRGAVLDDLRRISAVVASDQTDR